MYFNFSIWLFCMIHIENYGFLVNQHAIIQSQMLNCLIFKRIVFLNIAEAIADCSLIVLSYNKYYASNVPYVLYRKY